MATLIAFPDTKPIQVVSVSDPSQHPNAVIITGSLPDRKYVEHWVLSGTEIIIPPGIKEAGDARSALRENWLDLEGDQADMTGVPGAKSWITGPMEPYYDAANRLLKQGRKATAVDMIRLAPTPNGLTAEQIDIFEAVRAEIAAAVSRIPI